MEFTKSEAKQWAKKNFVGLEGVLTPSFTPDLSELDEEGIRWDVQYSIKQGYFSVMCAIESSALTQDERKKFVKIVCDEAKGKIKVSQAALMYNFDEQVDMFKYFEKVGGSSCLLGYPAAWFPKSEEEVYQAAKKMCESTNLAMTIYAHASFNFGRFHNSNYNPELIKRLADIPNVVAVKCSGGPGYIADCFRTVGDKLLVASPFEWYWPITVAQYGQQWGPAGDYDLYQIPENQRLVEEFKLLMKGDMDKAMKIYWALNPIREVEMQRFGPTSIASFAIFKYQQWLVGGNGGMIRQPRSIVEGEKMQAKNALKAIGITPREPDEEYYVGRTNYAKGLRMKTL